MLEGYRLDRSGRHYEAIEPDARGDFEVTAMGLKLGLRATTYRQYEQLFVRWLDRDGTPLPTAAERLTAERARADTERARADAEQPRADELAERLRAIEAESK